MISDAFYFHIFNRIPNFGPLRLAKLYQYFGSGEKAYKAVESELKQAGIEHEKISAFYGLKNGINLKNEYILLKKERIEMIGIDDAQYPALLRHIPQPPVLLYYRGVLGPADELCLAVVGTRKISHYGRSVVPNLITPLVEAGITIVSGLAYGIDAAAHQVSVDKNCRTVAVLGCGLDIKTIYPPNHAFLAEQIIATGGTLFSEYPPGTPALRYNFIARNRIISGLCVATTVIECNLKSGSLITAKHALDQNRSVYAVPGQIYSESSQGPNNLIKMGAKLITEAKDILEDLGISQKKIITPAQTSGDTKSETVLLKIISGEPIGIDELIRLSSLSTSEATSTITFLEIKGRVRNVGGQRYVKG